MIRMSIRFGGMEFWIGPSFRLEPEFTREWFQKMLLERALPWLEARKLKKRRSPEPVLTVYRVMEEHKASEIFQDLLPDDLKEVGNAKVKG